MIFATLLILSMTSRADIAVHDSCDLVEVNQVYDIAGNESFQQVVFWRWYRSEQRYHVREWRIFDNRATPIRNYRNGRYELRFTDHGVLRHVAAFDIRWSWTQFDVERRDVNRGFEVANRELFTRRVGAK